MGDKEAAIGYPVVSRELNPYWIAYLMSFVNQEVALTLGVWGVDLSVDTSPSREILGLQYPDLTPQIYDMVETLINFGIVPDLMNLKHGK